MHNYRLFCDVSHNEVKRSCLDLFRGAKKSIVSGQVSKTVPSGTGSDILGQWQSKSAIANEPTEYASHCDYNTHILGGNPDISSVGIALGYGLDDRGSRVRFPVGAGNFSLHQRVYNGSGAHAASYPMGTRGSFPGGKAAGP
jgi:hypothetical protein